MLTNRNATIAAVALATLVLAPAATAHVTLQPEEAPAGGFTRLDVRVPNERDNANSTRVEMRLPPGFLSVSSEPVPGWDVELTMRKLDEPVEEFGEEVTEEVGRITFSGGVIRPDQFQDFGLSLRVPDEPGATLRFPALQTYSNGEVVRWIGAPDSDEPAPTVEVSAAEDEGEGQSSEPEEEAAPPAAEEDDDSNTLAIVALIAAAAGLAAGLAALFRQRGRGRSPAR